MLTTVLQSIGNTPLLQLSPLCSDLPGRVWLKLENCNPGGSIKDRVAFHMVDRALDRGDVLPGGTLAERMDAYEAQIIRDSYQRCGTTVAVARDLGISQATAARKIAKYVDTRA